MFEGLVKPGDLVVGADSHTCTYGALGAFSAGIGATDMACAWAVGELWFRVPETIRVEVNGEFAPFVGAKDLILHIVGSLGVDGAIYQAIEFAGSTIHNLSMDGRFTICNMAIEAGAKTGLIEPDTITRKFVEDVEVRKGKRGEPRDYATLKSDPDAAFSHRLKVDAAKLRPMVAAPYLPSNVMTAEDAKETKVDQVMIGSCTNGRLEDFRLAASVMGKHKVHPDVRLLIVPATQEIYMGLIQEGLAEQFVAAGAMVTPPTCGPCMGGHMGVLGPKETGLFTTNRNSHGRNGHMDSRVYLAGPAVAAASALTGRITDPNLL